MNPLKFFVPLVTFFLMVALVCYLPVYLDYYLQLLILMPFILIIEIIIIYAGET